MIQESFQQCLYTAASTAVHHGYAPAPPFQQNVFGALVKDNSDEESIAANNALQVASLNHQSQLTLPTMANSSQCHNHQMAHLALQKDLMHQNMHQIIA